jgi:hypothetical protein
VEKPTFHDNFTKQKKEEVNTLFPKSFTLVIRQLIISLQVNEGAVLQLVGGVLGVGKGIKKLISELPTAATRADTPVAIIVNQLLS